MYSIAFLLLMHARTCWSVWGEGSLICLDVHHIIHPNAPWFLRRPFLRRGAYCTNLDFVFCDKAYVPYDVPYSTVPTIKPLCTVRLSLNKWAYSTVRTCFTHRAIVRSIFLLSTFFRFTSDLLPTYFRLTSDFKVGIILFDAFSDEKVFWNESWIDWHVLVK